MLEAFNTFLGKTEFPAYWRRARLTLILKKGKNNIIEASSYRLICLTDTLSKIYESMLKARLESEIERTFPLSERQFGFRAGKSTIDVIKYVVEEIKK